jgi:pimeloyl-ACP methyl ester carboxylesterase
VPFIRRVHSKLRAALAGYRLVMFDQRGTGAGALRCPALQAATGDSDLINPPPGVVESCARRIGPARRFFATSETVADIESLRLALNVPRLTLDGVSYGTFVAERYALRYPTHVARLVLDSVVPQVGLDPLYRAAFAASARVLRSVCAQDHCRWDPARDVARIVHTRHEGAKLLAALVAESVVLPDFPGVLEALHSAVNGNPAQLNVFIANGQNAYGVPASALSQGLHESTLCLDLAPPWDPAAPRAARAAALARLAASVPPRALYPFDRASAVGNAVAQECLRWPATRRPSLPIGSPSGPLPPIPVLIFAGERDLSTPMAWAQQEAARAPDARVVAVPGAGHSVQLRARDPLVRRALAAFLAGG